MPNPRNFRIIRIVAQLSQLIFKMSTQSEIRISYDLNDKLKFYYHLNKQ